MSLSARALGGALALVLVSSTAAVAQSPGTPPSATAASAAAKTIDARPWPRSYTVDGITFSIYRPQVDAWSGAKLQARAVMAVRTGETKDASGNPVTQQDYGVLWLNARTETDKEAREVSLENLTIERASFPAAKNREAQYLALARKVAPATTLVASLNQMEAALALSQANVGASAPVNNTPPEIIFSNGPAVLVLIDGQPVLKPSGIGGVERVINTRAVLLRHQGAYYLDRAGSWSRAPSLDGTWAPVAQPPAPVAQAAAKLTAAPGGKPAATAPAASQQVIVRTHPSELIVIGGSPALAPIPGTQF